jgi:hypothetical protein
MTVPAQLMASAIDQATAADSSVTDTVCAAAADKGETLGD